MSLKREKWVLDCFMECPMGTNDLVDRDTNSAMEAAASAMATRLILEFFP